MSQMIPYVQYVQPTGVYQVKFQQLCEKKVINFF